MENVTDDIGIDNNNVDNPEESGENNLTETPDTGIVTAGNNPPEGVSPESGTDETQEIPPTGDVIPEPSETEKLKKQVQDGQDYIKLMQSQNDKLAHQLSSVKPVEPETPAQPKPEPVAESFDTQEEYSKAYTDWKLEQSDLANEAKSKTDQLQQEETNRKTEFQTKATAFTEKQPEFWNVANSPIMKGFYGQHPHIGLAIETSDVGPEVAFYLGKNPAIAAKLGKMVPLNAILEMGKIASKFSETPPARKVSQAPTPINPGGQAQGSGIPKTVYSKGLTPAEYNKLRDEQEKKQAQAG